MMNLIIVKIGGNAIHSLTPDFFEQLKTWRQAGKKVLLITVAARRSHSWLKNSAFQR